MLDIISVLEPFFEDCSKRIGVREYARLLNISPPTASKILKEYVKEGLLLRHVDRGYHLYYAKKERLFIDISRLYWANKLRQLTEYLEHELVDPTIILFGSLSKAENTRASDVDLVIIARKKELKFDTFEQSLRRRIQAFWYTSINDIKNKDLATNIVNGHILRGIIRL